LAPADCFFDTLFSFLFPAPLVEEVVMAAAVAVVAVVDAV
jgi:hypothetical protein